MITFFTTTKNFTGKIKIIQINAIRSWMAADFPVEVIVFGKNPGCKELMASSSLIFIDKFNTSPSGAPFAAEIFAKVNQIANYDICCYVNADILLTNSFFMDIAFIHKKLLKNYLVTGQRIDVDVDNFLSFTKNWEVGFQREYRQKLRLHPPSGSDFFVFPKGIYNGSDMNTLLIGRPGWDLWMIFNARKKKYRVIDMSPSSRVFHQNHDYSHKQVNYETVFEDPEATLNLQSIPVGQKLLYTLIASNYYWKNGNYHKNFARNNFINYTTLEKSLNRQNYLFQINLAFDYIHYRIKNSVFLKLFFSRKRKFVIGSGNYFFENGWLFTDKNTLNITKENEWRKFLRFLHLDNILAEHVWEHLSETDVELANKNCYKFLKKGGVLRLAVPDGFHPDKGYIDYVKPGGSGAGADDHKILYTYKIMKPALEKAGFIVNLLEYWDENGNFHYIDWTDENGRIERSRRYDERNNDGKLHYTSLIVDAIKP